MSANDYGFFPSELTGEVYLARRIRSKDGVGQDRRIVDKNEIIGMFRCYLERFCKENNTDTLVVSIGGKTIFEAKLNTEKKCK